MLSELDPMAIAWREGWKAPDLRTVCERQREYAVIPDSARTDGNFNPEESPWLVDPLNDTRYGGPVRFNTFVKPVQIGGSLFGELAIEDWIETIRKGNIQYNWENNDKARDRWNKHFEKMLRTHRIVSKLLPTDVAKYKNGLIVWDHLNFTMQGVESDANLASDSVCAQVNEEIHNWDPGKLGLAYGRTTAFQDKWFHVANISNASFKGDQLHQALLSGTNRIWEHRCPGCGLFHSMHFRWQDDAPELGGLRYDPNCKRADGSYNYEAMKSSLRMQFPCGYPVPYDQKARKALNSAGNCRYSEPRNADAIPSEESRTLEAVAVHFIDWLLLVKERNEALKAYRYGDPKPLNKFEKERECKFVDPDDRPIVRDIVLARDVKKSREGMANRKLRLFALDHQQGSLETGDLYHWWLLIVDIGLFEGVLRIQIVFEGKILTDEQVIATLGEHDIKEGVNMHHGVADCTFNTKKVMAFCLRYGINATFGTGQAFFVHSDKAKRAWEVERPLHRDLNAPWKFPYVAARDKKGNVIVPRVDVPDRREPRFWRYSQVGILDLVHFLRSADTARTERLRQRKDGGTEEGVEIITPADVSEDFKKHMESWLCESKRATDGSISMEWRQIRERDDLLMCFGYIAMQMDRAGLIGSAIATTSKPVEVKIK